MHYKYIMFDSRGLKIKVCNLTYWYYRTVLNIPYQSDWDAVRKASQEYACCCMTSVVQIEQELEPQNQYLLSAIKPIVAWCHSVALTHEILPWLMDCRSWRTVKLLLSKGCGYLYFCQELLYTNLCWQVWSWAPVEVFPSWRSTDEHELASKCSGICECNTTHYRSRGKQNIT